MRLKTANNRRKRRERREQIDKRYVNFLRKNPDDLAYIITTFADDAPRTVTCKVCGVDKPFFKVNPSGVCSDCD